MNRIGTISLLVVSFATLNASALEAQQSPYNKIAGRNVFQLHAPVVVNVEGPPKTSPLRKATLTGITTILERQVAFITIEGTKSQPAEAVMIGKGQAVNGIEVKVIDEKAGAVRILNDGKLQILNFEPATASGLQSDQGLRAAPLPSFPARARSEAAMTSEEQTALIELQRVKLEQEGNPIHALLPPTELTSNAKDLAMP
jgi:hypothetical protein